MLTFVLNAFNNGGGQIDAERVKTVRAKTRFPTYASLVAASAYQKLPEPPEGFTLIKMAIGFHNPAQMNAMPGQWYDEPRGGAPHGNKGMLTEKGLKRIVASVEAMKKVLGDEVGLALDLQEKTVKHYMTSILQKLQVRNRVEAAMLAGNADYAPALELIEYVQHAEQPSVAAFMESRRESPHREMFERAEAHGLKDVIDTAVAEQDIQSILRGVEALQVKAEYEALNLLLEQQAIEEDEEEMPAIQDDSSWRNITTNSGVAGSCRQ